jgi:2-C-methyl-D-erythritol 4-phosphate cytidylyltransferase
MLKKAYQQEFRTSFTDDASVVEHAGVAIHLVEGDPKNIKITYPEDLALAEVFLKRV